MASAPNEAKLLSSITDVKADSLNESSNRARGAISTDNGNNKVVDKKDKKDEKTHMRICPGCKCEQRGHYIIMPCRHNVCGTCASSTGGVGHVCPLKDCNKTITEFCVLIGM